MYPLTYLPVHRRARVAAAAQSAIDSRLTALRLAEQYSALCSSVQDMVAAENHVVACRLRVRHAIAAARPGSEVRREGKGGKLYWAVVGYDGMTLAIYEQFFNPRSAPDWRKNMTIYVQFAGYHPFVFDPTDDADIAGDVAQAIMGDADSDGWIFCLIGGDIAQVRVA